MKCPLCRTNNPPEHKHCQLCDTLLSSSSDAASDISYTVIGTVDATQRFFSKRKLALIFLVIVLLILPWTLMSDLFVVPKDVKQSRELFSLLSDDYLANKDVWHQQKEQILSSMTQHETFEGKMNAELINFDNLSLGVLMAFFHENMGFNKRKFKSLSIYPINHLNETTFLISKYQRSVWPLHILVSLEIQLKFDHDKMNITFKRLRRGQRQVSPELAWTYFGPELELLCQLEPFVGNIRKLRFYRQTEPTTHHNDIRVGWQYRVSPHHELR